MYGRLKTVRTLVELGVDKEAKTKVRNRMMMMMMMVIFSVVTIMMIVGDDKGDSR
jgi:hypothetical protein